VCWWKFDEVSGTTAADSSGHGRHGRLKGNLSFDKCSVPGRLGKALMFDGGQDNYVEVTGYKGITGTAPRTVAAWIKTGRPRGSIVRWGSEDFGKLWMFGFVRRRQRIGITPKGGYLYMNDKTHDGKWHHVAVVVEPAQLPNVHDNVKLYKDGVIAEIHPIGLLDLWPIDTAEGSYVTIGKGFKGALDEVRIYQRALSADEIAALYRGNE